MLHLRLVVPRTASDSVVDWLREDPRVTNLVVLPGAGIEPSGDAVLCDVAREGASEILAQLRDLGLDRDSGITLSALEAAPTHNARAAERAAPGSPDDAVVWEVVTDWAYEGARGSWSFYVFMCLATTIAAVAVVTDSPILVVGAMVVGPEFSAVTAVAMGLALQQGRLALAGLRLLLLGFSAAIVVTTVLSLVVRALGWVDPATLERPRPLTEFIWSPDRWSIVVALLAGAAGVLSQTTGRSNALVGVFISVTTIPAAGNLALALALWVPAEMAGALAQLAVNLVGMVVSGALTLVVLRTAWRRFPQRIHHLGGRGVGLH